MMENKQTSGPRRMDPFGEGYVDPNKEKLEALSLETIGLPVRCLLHSETVQVLTWQYKLLKGRGGDAREGLGVYRFSGRARVQGQDVPWSMILKIIRPSRDEPSSYAGKREVLAYRSGFLDDLPGGLAAPQCLGINEWPDGEFWMWIEEVVDQVGDEWPIERFGLAARHLGQLNGTYLAGKPLPNQDWFSRKWLRQYTAQYGKAMTQLNTNLKHPLMRRVCPPDVAAQLERLWPKREPWLDLIEHLPQTFCHMDAFVRNLFARRSSDGHEETVAIDWPYAGIGAVGEELAPLVSMGLGRQRISLDDLHMLDRVVFKGYLEGLNDAGWNGDPDLARFGFVASAPLRYGFMSTRFVEFFNTLDKDRQTELERRMEAEWAQNEHFFAQFQHFLFSLADEATKLVKTVSSH